MSLSNLTPDIPWLSKLILMAIILLLTWLAAQAMGRFTRHFLRRDDVDLPSSTIFVNIIRVCIWMVGIAIVLKYCFNINAAAVLGALGVGGIAISLGFQQTLANLIGGLELSLNRLVTPKDFIQFGDITGQVTDVTWRHTSVIDVYGDLHIIPNSQINSESITRLDEKHYVEIKVLIPEVDDIESYSATLVQKAREGASSVAEVERVKFWLKGRELGGVSGIIEVLVKRESLVEKVLVSDAVMRAIIDLVQSRGTEDTPAEDGESA